MTRKAPISSALSDTERDITAKVLQHSLVDLHLAAKQAHWTVVGPFFRAVHLQLDELVAAARGYADDVAERAAALGVPPAGRVQTVADGSDVPALGTGWRDGREIVEFIVTALDKVIRRLRAGIDETDKTDLVTQDMLIEITAKLEEAHWMWQAQLAKS